MIRIDNVSKSFRGKPAVSPLSFEVHRGEMLGLLGHNGAGKSTTLGMLLGQVSPDQGEAFIDGHSVQNARGQALAKTGAIFEAPRFYDYMSGWRNLEIYTSYSARVPGAQIEEAVEIVNLTARIHDKVGTYSQGMRQRLGLAQALLPASEVLLLDEPTNGLDPEGIHEMRGLIKQLNRDRGITVLFCSHLLAEVEHLCDRVVVLKKGVKLFDGRWAEVADDRSRVRLEVNDWVAAREVIGREGRATIEDGGIVTLPEGMEIADLVPALVAAGVRIHAIEPQRRSLEQIYLELSHEAKDSAALS